MTLFQMQYNYEKTVFSCSTKDCRTGPKVQFNHKHPLCQLCTVQYQQVEPASQHLYLESRTLWNKNVTSVYSKQMGCYIFNSHMPICQNHVTGMFNIVSSGGCGWAAWPFIFDTCETIYELFNPIVTLHWGKTLFPYWQLSAPDTSAQKKQITPCCSSLVYMERTVAMLTAV